MMKLFLLGGFRGIVADYLWNRAEEYKREHDWDQPGPDRRDDHQAPAPLPGDLDLSELEPGLQRRRRVGRARGQVPVDQEGDPVRAGGREQEPAARPTWSGIPPGTTTTRSGSPTSRSSCGGSSATTRTPTSSGTTTPSGRRSRSATTTSSWATAGSAGRSSWWTRREDPPPGRHVREHPLRRPVAPAEGTRPTTSPSARCPRMPRPATPPRWRR